MLIKEAPGAVYVNKIYRLSIISCVFVCLVITVSTCHTGSNLVQNRFKSFVPGGEPVVLKESFSCIEDRYLEHSLWKCPRVIAKRPHELLVNIVSGNDLCCQTTSRYLNQC